MDWEESPSSPTLFSKTNKEPAVVALPLVVHEETIVFNWARGPMVHLFGSEVEVVRYPGSYPSVDECHFEQSGACMWRKHHGRYIGRPL